MTKIAWLILVGYCKGLETPTRFIGDYYDPIAIIIPNKLGRLMDYFEPSNNLIYWGL